MTNINRVIMAGNLTHDPEYRELPSETGVVNFSVALNRRWKNRDGEMQEETTYVDCEAFGRQAEVLRDYARKGRGVCVEGRLRLDRWEDREGQNRSKLRVVAERVQFTDAPTDADDSDEQPNRGRDDEPRRRSTPKSSKAPTRKAKVKADDKLPF